MRTDWRASGPNVAAHDGWGGLHTVGQSNPAGIKRS